jgi:hypothetical protein
LEYQITSQNDVERQGGNQETFITVSKVVALDIERPLIFDDREVCWHPWLNTLEGKGQKGELRERMVKVEELSLETTVLFSRWPESRRVIQIAM